MHDIDDQTQLSRFVAALSAEFAAVGLMNAATLLDVIGDTAFTTSSEWLGELGTAVKRIRADAADARAPSLRSVARSQQKR